MRDEDMLTSLAGRLARLAAQADAPGRGRDPRRQRRAVAPRTWPTSCWTPSTPTSTWRWPRPRPAWPIQRRSRSPRRREELVGRATAPLRRPGAAPDAHRHPPARRADHRHRERGPRHRAPVSATSRRGPRSQSFRQFIEENRDEITALQIIYSQPYAQQRLTYQQVKELARARWRCRPRPGPPSRCGGPTPNWSGTRCAAWARSGC